MSGSGSNRSKQESERRRSRRIPLDAVVHYQVGGSEFINLASNLSSEGIFIKNFSPPPIGTDLRIKVTLPPEFGSIPVTLVGRVVRVVDSVGEEESGMGVEFTSVWADSEEAVRTFVNQIYEAKTTPRVEPSQPPSSGFAFKPGPEDVLRLQPEGRDDASLPGFESEPHLNRLIWSGFLLLIGILLGGGLVLVFFMGQ